MEINSITIDSTNSITDLCKLGAEYPTDKSPYATENYNTQHGSGHRHPYTSVYNFIFSSLRYQKIKLAEIGILDNMSMVCWREYFPNAELFGFDYNSDFIKLGIETGLQRTTYDFIDVNLEESIKNCLSTYGKFDIIIDDSTHVFEDQIRFCNVAYKYLNEGGILIIEDVFRDESEEKYKEGLSEVSKYFSTMTFVVTEHELLYSPGWNNDKLLILFRNNVEETMFINIITPCSRPENLHKMSESINLPRENYRWIVVFDSLFLPDKSYIPDNCEYYHHRDSNSVFGNGQRNFALDLVKKGHVYFNDDDTLIHPELWDNIKDSNEDFISFDQSFFDGQIRLHGDRVEECFIDSHNFITSYELSNDIRWDLDKYASDGVFAVKCYGNAKTKKYINKSLSIYNHLNYI